MGNLKWSLSGYAGNPLERSGYMREICRNEVVMYKAVSTSNVDRVNALTRSLTRVLPSFPSLVRFAPKMMGVLSIVW